MLFNYLLAGAMRDPEMYFELGFARGAHLREPLRRAVDLVGDGRTAGWIGGGDGLALSCAVRELFSGLQTHLCREFCQSRAVEVEVDEGEVRA